MKNQRVLFFHIAMRQFSKCQHHPWTECACARRSILVLQAAFRVERVRERAIRRRFEAVFCVFIATETSCESEAAAASQQDMGSSEHDMDF
ncbi:hypothetical protein JOB18_025347 [Solea senegalensis]|uniref:Uncharacterized protein n=1 Tax=Solea senegalensis TaxID=28829 RepID=A0AAV6RBL5_SOLSE|nr:hypothetical protein JOB18_025347 [Solea senegalensis]